MLQNNKARSVGVMARTLSKLLLCYLGAALVRCMFDWLLDPGDVSGLGLMEVAVWSSLLLLAGPFWDLHEVWQMWTIKELSAAICRECVVRYAARGFAFFLVPFGLALFLAFRRKRDSTNVR